MKIQVATTAEFLKAIQVENQEITLLNSLLIPQSIQLAPGVSITATREKLGFLSFPAGDGIGIQADNTIKNICIQTKADSRAIYLNSLQEDLGTITLKNLRITGQVQILLREHNHSLDLIMDSVDIVSADARLKMEKSIKNQLNMLQGALTIFNCSAFQDSKLTLSMEKISIGRHEAPVIGSGIFIADLNNSPGRVQVDLLSHNEIFSNSMIPNSSMQKSSGAICILEGVQVNEIISEGLLTTYGPHDHAIYNEGIIDRWILKEAVRSHGQGASGMINNGKINDFNAEDTFETYGAEASALILKGGHLVKGHFPALASYGKNSVTVFIAKEAKLESVNFEGTIEHKGENSRAVKIEEDTSLSPNLKEQLASYL